MISKPSARRTVFWLRCALTVAAVLTLVRLFDRHPDLVRDAVFEPVG